MIQLDDDAVKFPATIAQFAVMLHSSNEPLYRSYFAYVQVCNVVYLLCMDAS